MGKKERQEVRAVRHGVVFTALVHYLRQRGIIEDTYNQYHILNTIIQASFERPRRPSSATLKKLSS